MTNLILTRADARESSLDETQRYQEFVASTTTLDAHETIVRQNWKLDRYRKNPIVLRDHDTRKPIGTAEVRIEGDQLVAGVTFATGDENADATWNLVRQRVLRAVSVGFRPSDFDVREADGEVVIVYDAPDLFEISVVSVPSNPDALARAYQASSDAEAEIRRAAVVRLKEKTMAEATKPAPATEAAPAAVVQAPETITKEAHDLVVKSLRDTLADRDAIIAKLETEAKALRADATKARDEAIEAHVRSYVGKKLTAKSVDGFMKIAKSNPTASVEEAKATFDDLLKEMPDLGFGIGERVAATETTTARASGAEAKQDWIDKRTSERVREFGETRFAAMKAAMQEAEAKGL